MTTRNAIVLRHVAFEDLDTLGGVLARGRFHVRYIDTPVSRDFADEVRSADLLVVLGGPIAVYDDDDYPFLKEEVRLVRERLSSGRPVLGICLGAQIMARALGARVYPGARGKEIGWKPLALTAQAADSPLAALASGDSVLHWHGDTFDVPQGCTLLAGTDQYPHQAFSHGRHGLALQFHIEPSAPGLERWYVGHAVELSKAKIDIPALRASSERHAPAANVAMARVIERFLTANFPA